MSSRVLDKSAAFGGEPDIFDIFKMMLGEGNKRFNNPLRRLLRPKVYTGPYVMLQDGCTLFKILQRQFAILDWRTMLPCRWLQRGSTCSCTLKGMRDRSLKLCRPQAC